MLILTGCKSKEKKQSEVMINDFENNQQLALMKFPFPKHSDRGKFDLSNEHVTHGDKSLKYTNDYGSYIEVCHYFDHIADSNIDVSDIKSLDLDIYNDSPFDSSCVFIIYSGKEMMTLLNQEYELKKGEATHLSFPLSKLALEYNFESITCSSLRIFTPNTDYDKGIGYTFYLDNWHAKMGSEYTEEDTANKPKIDAIKDKIDAFPKPESVSLDNGDGLKEVANLLNDLPNIYRRAVPNLSAYKELVEAYYNLVSATEVIDYDKNPFINFDKFYGSAQLTPTEDTRAEVLYTEESWPGNAGYEGSTKIIFQGSTDSRFTYKSNANLNDFDFIHICIYNASRNYLRVWFSYNHETFLDVPSGETVSVSFSASLLTDQYYWAFHHMKSMNNSNLLGASGEVYLRQMYVTGRSQETMQKHMKHAFECLPTPSELVSEDDYLMNLTAIVSARELYEEVMDKTTITSEQLANLEALEAKVATSGYGMAYNAYEGAMTLYSFGINFAAEIAVSDNDFGFVNTANLVNVPAHSDNPNMHEQAFTFAGDVAVKDEYLGYSMFVYNPTSVSILLIVRNTNWEWEKYSHLFTNVTLSPGWNKVEIKKELFYISDDRKVSIFITDEGSNRDINGEWKFSSLFGLPRSI